MLSWIGRVVHAAGVGVDDMEKPQVSARAYMLAGAGGDALILP